MKKVKWSRVSQEDNFTYSTDPKFHIDNDIPDWDVLAMHAFDKLT